MVAPLLIAKSAQEMFLLPDLANRHGLIASATGPRGGRRDGVVGMAAKSTARAIGSQVGREIIRGVPGSILGSGRRR